MRCSTEQGRRALLRAVAVASVGAVAACAQPGGFGNMASADRTIIIAVNFDLNSHRIRPEYFASLDSIAGAMASQQLAADHFVVDGHTDLSGRLAYNIALSNLRADAVVNYLVRRGVPPRLLRSQGFGPLNLLNPDDPFGAENRRVEITSVR